MTQFAAGVHACSQNAAAAKTWIKFFQSPEAAAVIKAKGLEPPVAAKAS